MLNRKSAALFDNFTKSELEVFYICLSNFYFKPGNLPDNFFDICDRLKLNLLDAINYGNN